MKKILTIALLLIAINAQGQGQGLSVPANATLASLFPDENLRRVVAEVLGPNAGLVGQRLSDALAGIEELEASNRGISDASGIEYLVNLTKLDLRRNKLANININNLIYLVDIILEDNLLTSLNTGSFLNLIFLYVGNNQLINLDISNNINLTNLDISNNISLTNLDISNNISLTSLDISNNISLTNLDISNNINLVVIWAYRSPLSKEGIIGLNDNVQTVIIDSQ